jgi:hypothetical protein
MQICVLCASTIPTRATVNYNCTLASLNYSDRFAVTNLITNYLLNDDEAGIFSDITIKSDYFICTSLAAKLSNKSCPLLLSLNIQRLQSKYRNLLQLITTYKLFISKFYFSVLYGKYILGIIMVAFICLLLLYFISSCFTILYEN